MSKVEEKKHVVQEGDLATGAQILLECLIREGVEELFGYPGGAVLNIYDELYKCSAIKHYLVRHEQAAIHAAEGYARVSGKVGVAICTSGPGATNAITGIANAYLDAYPLVVFTGQVGSNQIGNDAFQEADIVGITRSCCKHNYLVKNVKDLPRVIKEAFHIAKTGKPGPVVIDLPKDITSNKMEFNYPDRVNLPGYKPTYIGHPKQIVSALKMLCKAKRPVIISGGGVTLSDASNEVTTLAKKLNIPVANTLMGAGTFPQTDDLSLDMLGMHGSYYANHAVSNADVVFAIGTRFNDRITGCLKRFCAQSKVIHIDIDPCSISKNVAVDIPIVGDAKIILAAMIDAQKEHNFDTCAEDKNAWMEQINAWKEKKPMLAVQCTGKLSPQCVIEDIYNFTKEDHPVICTEVGQHQMWTAQLYKFDKPRHFVTSGGLGTMGFGFPSAVGASIAQKNKPVFNIAGDGSLQMNIQELMTCVDYNLPVITCIINNGYLGMVRQWQEKIYQERYSHTHISSPDFVKVAEAYGAKGIRVDSQEQILPALQEAVEYKGPVFIDFIVEPMEMVYPWVLAGKPIDKVIMTKDCEG